MKAILHSYFFLEKLFRYFSLAFALIAFLVFREQQVTWVFLLFLILASSYSYYITQIVSRTLTVKHPTLATLDAIIAIACITATGSSQSPFILYLFATIMTVNRLLKPIGAAFYVIIMMLFLLADVLVRMPAKFSENLFILLPSITGIILFAGIVSFFLTKVQNKVHEIEATPPLEEIEQPEESAAQKTEFTQETAINYLWEMIDIQRDMEKAYTIDSAVKTYLHFLARMGFPPLVVLFFKKDSLLEVFSVMEGSLESADLEGILDPETFAPPDEFEITHKGTSYSMILISSIPEASTFIPQPTIEEDQFMAGVLKLISDIFSYKIAQLVLQSKETILLSRFSSLYNAAVGMGEKLEKRPVLESAAEAVKGLTGMEKVVVMLASSPEDVELDFSRTVVKGRKAEHPEVFWKDPLLESGKKCIGDGKSTFSEVQKGKSHMVCVPISFRSKILGVIAGITSLPKEEVLGDLKTLEVIAALTATSLTNLNLIESREEVAVSSEKDRIAHEVHERLVGSLYEILLSAETSLHNVKSKSPDSIKGLISLRKEIQETLKDTRKFIYEIYPEAHSSMGFKTAFERLVSSYGESSKNIELKIATLPEPLPIEIENAILKVSQEAISNSLRHGKAKKITLTLNKDKDGLHLSITDDGVGFSPKAALEKIKEEKKVGIYSMFETVKEVGGKLQISSSRSKGTSIEAHIPIA